MIKVDECERTISENNKIIDDLKSHGYVEYVSFYEGINAVLREIIKEYRDIDEINQKVITGEISSDAKAKEEIKKIKRKIEEKTKIFNIIEKNGKKVAENVEEIEKLKKSHSKIDEDRIEYFRIMNSYLISIKGKDEKTSEVITSKKNVVARSSVRNVFSTLIGQLDKKIANAWYNPKTEAGTKRWEKHCANVENFFNKGWHSKYFVIRAVALVMGLSSVVMGGSVVGTIIGAGMLAYSTGSFIFRYADKKRFGGPILVNPPKPTLQGTYFENIRESLFENINSLKMKKRNTKNSSKGKKNATDSIERTTPGREHESMSEARTAIASMDRISTATKYRLRIGTKPTADSIEITPAIDESISKPKPAVDSIEITPAADESISETRSGEENVRRKRALAFAVEPMEPKPAVDSIEITPATYESISEPKPAVKRLDSNHEEENSENDLLEEFRSLIQNLQKYINANSKLIKRYSSNRFKEINQNDLEILQTISDKKNIMVNKFNAIDKKHKFDNQGLKLDDWHIFRNNLLFGKRVDGILIKYKNKEDMDETIRTK